MSDESQLQVGRKDDESSLILSSVSSSLVARGRRDAALLTAPCNKCRERKELVFAGYVRANCSDALDAKWAASTATDWVLVARQPVEQWDAPSVATFLGVLKKLERLE